MSSKDSSHDREHIMSKQSVRLKRVTKINVCEGDRTMLVCNRASMVAGECLLGQKHLWGSSQSRQDLRRKEMVGPPKLHASIYEV